MAWVAHRLVCIFLWHDYWRVRKIAKIDLQLRHVSVRPHGTTRPPLDVFMKFDIRVFLENLSRKFKID
jgi:hypothetical protein